jgi:hypothetical protein
MRVIISQYSRHRTTRTEHIIHAEWHSLRIVHIIVLEIKAEQWQWLSEWVSEIILFIVRTGGEAVCSVCVWYYYCLFDYGVIIRGVVDMMDLCAVYCCGDVCSFCVSCVLFIVRPPPTSKIKITTSHTINRSAVCVKCVRSMNTLTVTILVKICDLCNTHVLKIISSSNAWIRSVCFYANLSVCPSERWFTHIILWSDFLFEWVLFDL